MSDISIPINRAALTVFVEKAQSALATGEADESATWTGPSPTALQVMDDLAKGVEGQGNQG